VLQLDNKLYNNIIWEPLDEIRGNLSHFGKGVPKVRDAKFLDNIRNVTIADSHLVNVFSNLG